MIPRATTLVALSHGVTAAYRGGAETRHLPWLGTSNLYIREAFNLLWKTRGQFAPSTTLIQWRLVVNRIEGQFDPCLSHSETLRPSCSGR